MYVPISLAANIQEFVVTHQCLIGFMATKAASGRKVNRSIELFSAWQDHTPQYWGHFLVCDLRSTFFYKATESTFCEGKKALDCFYEAAQPSWGFEYVVVCTGVMWFTMVRTKVILFCKSSAYLDS